MPVEQTKNMDNSVSVIDYLNTMLKMIDDKFVAMEEKATSELASSDRSIQIQIMAMETATKLALETSNHRLDNTNEWRTTVTGMIADMLTRREWNAWKEGVERTISDLKSGQLILVSKAEHDAVKDKINDLTNKVNQYEIVLNTKASTRSQITRDVITGITLVVTTVTFLIMLYKFSLGI